MKYQNKNGRAVLPESLPKDSSSVTRLVAVKTCCRFGTGSARIVTTASSKLAAHSGQESTNERSRFAPLNAPSVRPVWNRQKRGHTRGPWSALRVSELVRLPASSKLAARSWGGRKHSAVVPFFVTPILWLLMLLAFCGTCAWACGPFFPNMMLVGGDGPVFTAPVARFYDELARAQHRLKIPKPPYPVVESTNDQRTATREIEATDLLAALRKSGLKRPAAEALLQAYNVKRDALVRYSTQHEQWLAARTRSWEPDTDTPEPELPAFSIPPGLPGEFADYFRGALAWHQGNTNRARAAWMKLLERPAAERHYKSTWAAFMLAKSFEKEKPGQAVTYYSLTRALAREGFADSLGLAAASIGWQARAHLQNHESEKAIEMYLEQLALDDGTAYQSLRIAARQALDSRPAVLEVLAKNPRTRAVLNAHLISTEWNSWLTDKSSTRSDSWLQAVERANVKDVDSAEQFALAYYQMGRFDVALRWVKRATNSPVAQWVQAKLLLRDGKVDQAVTILAKLTRVFPLLEPTNSTNAALWESLYVRGAEGGQLSIGRQALGELGVLRLHRREYAQALDALLHAGFWCDAAYVAERVLTADELKNYVDRHWPEILHDDEQDRNAPEEMKPSVQSKHIRYLLGRRLTRLGRSIEAREYFPGEWLADFDQLVLHLANAQDETRPPEERATNYFAAGGIVRTNGLELIGTEMQPDFTVWGGNFEDGPNSDDRSAQADTAVTGASADELRRATAHGVEPNERFHYRWHAAALGLEAAKLLPNHSDFTARVLYDSGRWIKNRDPDTADIFYKMLVRRCRKTELGDAADQQRWFPALDANGRPMVNRYVEDEIILPDPIEERPEETEAEEMLLDITPDIPPPKAEN